VISPASIDGGSARRRARLLPDRRRDTCSRLSRNLAVSAGR
jgi:hypothetical protein